MEITKHNFDQAFFKLQNYCQREGYKGWDNFDGLKSNLFRNSPLYRSSILRLVWIQFFKRSPINFRKLMLVPKDVNPKGLALFVSGLVLCEDYCEAKKLIDSLNNMTCSGYSGTCWGYNFDWQSRNFMTPLGSPNIVATVFVANSLLDYYDKTNDMLCLETALDACEFFLKNLVLFEDTKRLCFGYMPGSKARVHNVNMMAATLLGRVYRITQDNNYYKKSKKAMAYAINSMNSDYSWCYGESKHQEFIDNFHTGYNIVSLKNWMEYTGDDLWMEELRKAYDYYLKTFWLNNGCPKYYNNSLYPIDIHCSAQGIITCLEMMKYEAESLHFAQKIAWWSIENMQSEKGYFYYQKTKYYTNKIPYIRWSQAWMFFALSRLVADLENTC